MKRRIPVVLAAAGALFATVLSGCSALSPSSSDDGDIVLRVQGMPAATDKAGLEQFQRWVEEFEKANPGITIKGTTNVWDPVTFSAKLAGETVEDVISVPLTEPQGLITRKQVLSITDQLNAWEHYKELNPQVLQPLTDSAGDVYGVPQFPYAQGLVYNRALFEQAGLDPDKPPSTWDDVRAYAKQIQEKTGKAGFVHESKDGQGGWQLTMLTYAYGGEMLAEQDGKYVSAFNSAPTKDALALLKAMRWSDNSMGENQLLNQDDVIKQFAAGQVGMFMGTPGTYRLAKTNYGMEDTENYGIGPMPQQGGKATLTGGQVFMIPANVSEEKVEAAVKWLTFAYLQPNYDPQSAVEQAKKQSADPKAVIGLPTIPLFNQEQQDKINAAIEPYINVEVEHFQSYLDGTKELELRPEPALDAQAIYASLDSTVQAVLTDENADIDALLAAAETDIGAKLEADQE